MKRWKTSRHYLKKYFSSKTLSGARGEKSARVVWPSGRDRVVCGGGDGVEGADNGSRVRQRPDRQTPLDLTTLYSVRPENMVVGPRRTDSVRVRRTAYYVEGGDLPSPRQSGIRPENALRPRVRSCVRVRYVSGLCEASWHVITRGLYENADLSHVEGGGGSVFLVFFLDYE